CSNTGTIRPESGWEKSEVLMIEYVSIVETDMVIHTAKTYMMKLVVEIECFGMSADEFDKKTRSSDGLQPKQADLSCVHCWVILVINPLYLTTVSFGVDAAMDFKEKHAKCLMLLVKDLVLSSQDDAVD
nr:hypothetical protein [Tanacetum cinerariifolium]